VRGAHPTFIRWCGLRTLLGYENNHNCDKYYYSLEAYLAIRFKDEIGAGVIKLHKVLETTEWWNPDFLGGNITTRHYYLIVEINGVMFSYDPWKANPYTSDPMHLNGKRLDSLPENAKYDD